MTDTLILSGWLVVVGAMWYYLLRAYVRYEEAEEANERLRSELKYLRYRELGQSEDGPFSLDMPDEAA